MLYRGGSSKNVSNKRDTPNERVLFGRLWRGTFQAVFAEKNSKYRRALLAEKAKQAMEANEGVNNEMTASHPHPMITAPHPMISSQHQMISSPHSMMSAHHTDVHGVQGLQSYGRCQRTSSYQMGHQSRCEERQLPCPTEMLASPELDEACLNPDLRKLLARMRRPCCCHCSCVPHPVASSHDIDNLQVYLANTGHQRAMRSVIRLIGLHDLSDY